MKFNSFIFNIWFKSSKLNFKIEISVFKILCNIVIFIFNFLRVIYYFLFIPSFANFAFTIT